MSNERRVITVRFEVSGERFINNPRQETALVLQQVVDRLKFGNHDVPVQEFRIKDTDGHVIGTAYVQD